MLSLHDLPNELLKHIAGYLPCTSLFNLLQVSRRLNKACNDQLVFQSIADNGLYNITGAIDHLHQMYSEDGRLRLGSGWLNWSEGRQVLQHASFAQTKRLAYAIERSFLAAGNESDDWTLKECKLTLRHNTCDWLPQMIALRHPVTLCFEPNTFLRLQDVLYTVVESDGATLADSIEAKQHTAEFINVNFIFNYLTMQRISSTKRPRDALRLLQDAFLPSWLEHVPRPLSPEKEREANHGTIQGLRARVPAYRRYSEIFTLSQAMAVLPAMVIQLVEQQSNAGQIIDLPTPSRISFDSFMDIPAISDGTAEAFSTCHVSCMTTPEFLTGRWRGYYSDQRGPDVTGFIDPPMQDIHIFAEAPTEEQRTQNSKAMIDGTHGLSGGRDSHGEFKLDGSIQDDGRVVMSKTYVGVNYYFSWRGHLTPFGIVGVWGEFGNFGGYFWIWKEDWS